MNTIEQSSLSVGLNKNFRRVKEQFHTFFYDYYKNRLLFHKYFRYNKVKFLPI